MSKEQTHEKASTFRYLLARSNCYRSCATRASCDNLGGLGAKDLVFLVWNRAVKDDLLGRAAQLSYFFLLALFPFAISLSMLLGNFLDHDSKLLQYMGQVMPGSAFRLVRETLVGMMVETDTGVMTVGFALSVWVASSGMTAIMEGLNIAYNVPEVRSWWKRRLVSIGLTASLLVWATAGFLVMASGASVLTRLGMLFPVIYQVVGLSDGVHWTLGILFILLFLIIIFRFAPSLQLPRWEVGFPGAVLTLICWLAASAVLNLYLFAFGSYNEIYGTMGAAILLLIWLYISGAALLLGGEFNSVMWQAVVQQRKRNSDYLLLSP
jgi:membrane protein